LRVSGAIVFKARPGSMSGTAITTGTPRNQPASAAGAAKNPPVTRMALGR